MDSSSIGSTGDDNPPVPTIISEGSGGSDENSGIGDSRSAEENMKECTIRREEATKFLSAKMVQGYIVLGTLCDHCDMPILAPPVGTLGDPGCVVCPAMGRGVAAATATTPQPKEEKKEESFKKEVILSPAMAALEKAKEARLVFAQEQERKEREYVELGIRRQQQLEEQKKEQERLAAEAAERERTNREAERTNREAEAKRLEEERIAAEIQRQQDELMERKRREEERSLEALRISEEEHIREIRRKEQEAITKIRLEQQQALEQRRLEEEAKMEEMRRTEEERLAKIRADGEDRMERLRREGQLRLNNLRRDKEARMEAIRKVKGAIHKEREEMERVAKAKMRKKAEEEEKKQQQNDTASLVPSVEELVEEMLTITESKDEAKELAVRLLQEVKTSSDAESSTSSFISNSQDEADNTEAEADDEEKEETTATVNGGDDKEETAATDDENEEVVADRGLVLAFLHQETTTTMTTENSDEEQAAKEETVSPSEAIVVGEEEEEPVADTTTEPVENNKIQSENAVEEIASKEQEQESVDINKINPSSDDAVEKPADGTTEPVENEAEEPSEKTVEKVATEQEVQAMLSSDEAVEKSADDTTKPVENEAEEPSEKTDEKVATQQEVQVLPPSDNTKTDEEKQEVSREIVVVEDNNNEGVEEEEATTSGEQQEPHSVSPYDQAAGEQVTPSSDEQEPISEEKKTTEQGISSNNDDEKTEKKPKVDAAFVAKLESEARAKADAAMEAVTEAEKAQAEVNDKRKEAIATVFAQYDSEAIAEVPDVIDVELEEDSQNAKASPAKDTEDEDDDKEQWGALRAGSAELLKTRVTDGWTVLAGDVCLGKECGNCPLVTKSNTVLCNVCGGCGNGSDGLYANALQSNQPGGSTGALAEVPRKSVSELKQELEDNNKKASKYISVKLAEGWALNDEPCSECKMPVMSKDNLVSCVLCGPFFESSPSIAKDMSEDENGSRAPNGILKHTKSSTPQADRELSLNASSKSECEMQLVTAINSRNTITNSVASKETNEGQPAVVKSVSDTTEKKPEEKPTTEAILDESVEVTLSFEFLNGLVAESGSGEKEEAVCQPIEMIASLGEDTQVTDVSDIAAAISKPENPQKTPSAFTYENINQKTRRRPPVRSPRSPEARRPPTRNPRSPESRRPAARNPRSPEAKRPTVTSPATRSARSPEARRPDARSPEAARSARSSEARRSTESNGESPEARRSPQDQPLVASQGEKPSVAFVDKSPQEEANSPKSTGTKSSEDKYQVKAEGGKPSVAFKNESSKEEGSSPKSTETNCPKDKYDVESEGEKQSVRFSNESPKEIANTPEAGSPHKQPPIKSKEEPSDEVPKEKMRSPMTSGPTADTLRNACSPKAASPRATSPRTRTPRAMGQMPSMPAVFMTKQNPTEQTKDEGGLFSAFASFFGTPAEPEPVTTEYNNWETESAKTPVVVEGLNNKNPNGSEQAATEHSTTPVVEENLYVEERNGLEAATPKSNNLEKEPTSPVANVKESLLDKARTGSAEISSTKQEIGQDLNLLDKEQEAKFEEPAEVQETKLEEEPKDANLEKTKIALSAAFNAEKMDDPQKEQLLRESLQVEASQSGRMSIEIASITPCSSAPTYDMALANKMARDMELAQDIDDALLFPCCPATYNKTDSEESETLVLTLDAGTEDSGENRDEPEKTPDVITAEERDNGKAVLPQTVDKSPEKSEVEMEPEKDKVLPQQVQTVKKEESAEQPKIETKPSSKRIRQKPVPERGPRCPPSPDMGARSVERRLRVDSEQPVPDSPEFVSTVPSKVELPPPGPVVKRGRRPPRPGQRDTGRRPPIPSGNRVRSASPSSRRSAPSPERSSPGGTNRKSKHMTPPRKSLTSPKKSPTVLRSPSEVDVIDPMTWDNAAVVAYDDGVSVMSGETGANSVASEALSAVLNKLEDCKATFATSVATNDIAKQAECAQLMGTLATAAVSLRRLEQAS